MNSSIKFRVVIDTNIFISALLWGGIPGLLLTYWRSKKFILLLSPFLLGEIVTVLERFPSTLHQREMVKKELEANSIRVIPKNKTSVCRDKKDNSILDLCLAGQADFLITGDKDLLSLKKFQDTTIMGPKKFLRAIRSSEIP